MQDKALSFDESVAKRLESMTRIEALEITIEDLQYSDIADIEAARRLLIVMRNELIGGKRDDIIEANLSKV